MEKILFYCIIYLQEEEMEFKKIEHLIYNQNFEIIKEQDEQLNEIESSVKRIKQNAKLINQTIDDQKVYIQEMNDGMDQTQKKMGTAMKKIGEFLQTQNQSQIKLFLSLLCVAIVMFLILLLF